MTKTLLEQAKEIPVRQMRRMPNDEEIELAVGWLQEQVTVQQVSKVLGKKTGGSVYIMAFALKEAFRKNLIKI